MVAITLPLLRDRQEDIPVLAPHFVDHYCREVNRAPMGIERAALEGLQSYPWPGNVRELQNAIERAVVLAPGPEITAADLPAEARKQSPGPASASASFVWGCGKNQGEAHMAERYQVRGHAATNRPDRPSPRPSPAKRERERQ